MEKERVCAYQSLQHRDNRVGPEYIYIGRPDIDREYRFVHIGIGDRGGTVVKVLCYKSEGRWFDPSWNHWNFSLI